MNITQTLELTSRNQSPGTNTRANSSYNSPSRDTIANVSYNSPGAELTLAQ